MSISSNGTNSPDTIFFLSLSDIGGNSGVGIGAETTGPEVGNIYLQWRPPVGWSLVLLQ